jgi:DNA uptake protein ComE-like DNA-binding protein
LIVLLCLITAAGILLIWNDRPAPEKDSGLKPAMVESRESVHAADSLPPGTVSTQREKPVETAKNGKNNPKRNSSGSGGEKSKPADRKESVADRVERLTSYSRPSYPRAEKFREGTVVELNTADTAILKKVPGIGSTFAKRIIGYRNLLGGYYSVTQLSEVYGIDEDKYNALAPWFSADGSLVSRLNVNSLPQDSLSRHPYVNYRQAKVIAQLRKQKGTLTGWENLLLLNEFTDADRIRLQPYLSFE